jgi:autotransporter-associated beta strand protein
MTDLLGVNLTVVFGPTVNFGYDPNGPYTNSGKFAVLTLDLTTAPFVIEAANAFSDGFGGLSVEFEGAGDFYLQGANAFTGDTYIAGTARVDIGADDALGFGDITFLAGASAPVLFGDDTHIAISQTVNVDAGVSATLEANSPDTMTLNGVFNAEGGAGTTLHIDSGMYFGTVVLNTSATNVNAAGALSVDGGILELASPSAAALVSALTAPVTVTGTLDLGGQAVTIQDLAGAGTIVDSSATAASLKAAGAFEGDISGNISLEVADALYLTGANTFSGLTTVDSGARLSLGDIFSSGSLTGNVKDNGTFAFDDYFAMSYAGAVSGAGFLTTLGPGRVTLSGDLTGFSGDFEVLSGTLSLASASIRSPKQNADVTGALEASGGSYKLLNLTIDGNATLEATANSFLSNAGTFVDLNTTAATLHIGSATDTGTVHLGSTSAVGAKADDSLSVDGGTLEINDANVANYVSGLKTVTVNGMLDINGQSMTLTDFSGFGQVENSGAAMATLTLGEPFFQALAFTGVISGNLALHVAAGDFTILAGANTYTGGTTIDAGGTLSLGLAGASGSIVGPIVDNGSLAFNESVDLTLANSLSGSGFLSKAAADKLTLTGANAGFTGTIVLGGGTITIANAAALGAANKVMLEGGALEAAVDYDFTGQLELTSPNSQPGTLEATNGHTLTLSGPLVDDGNNQGINSKGSLIHIGSASDTGTVVLDNSGGAGFQFAGAAIEVDGGALTVVGAETLGNAGLMLNGGTLMINTTAALNLKGAATFSGGATAGTQKLVLKAGGVINGAVTVGGSGGWFNYGTLTQSGAGAVTFGDASNAAVAVTNASTGVWDIANNNGIALGDTAASTFYNQGTLEKTGLAGTIVIAASVSGGGTVTAATGILDLTGANSLISGALTGAGEIEFGGGVTSLNAGTTASVAKLLVANTASLRVVTNLSYAGSFTEQGGASVSVGGGDTLTLTGTTSLSGSLIGAGTLAMSGGAATISSPATLTMADWTSNGTALTIFGAHKQFGPVGASNETITLNGGALVIGGAATLTNLTLAGSQALQVNAATTLSGGLTIGATTSLVNVGAGAQSGAMTIGDASNGAAVFKNAAGGKWTLADGSSIAAGDAAASLINYGTLQKTAGASAATVSVGVANNSKLAVSSGALDIAGAVTGTGAGTITGAATLEFDASVAAGQTINFSGAGGTLDLTDFGAFSGRIHGFDTAGLGSSDTIEVAGPWTFVNFVENAAHTSGALTFADGATNHSLTLLGNYNPASFATLVSGGNTLVTYT